MIRIKEQDEQLIIREYPINILLTIIPYLVIVFFLFSVCFYRGLSISIGSFLSLPFVLVIFYCLSKFTIITIKSDKTKQQITMEKQTLFKYEIFQYFFSELDGLIFIKEHVSLDDVTYELIVPLKSNAITQKISSIESQNSDYNNVAKVLNNFIQYSSGNIASIKAQNLLE